MTLRAGKLISDTGEFLCILRDVSRTGTRARLFHPLPAGARYYLELSNGERLEVEPVWQNGSDTGFRFIDRPVEVDTLLKEDGAHPRRQIRLWIQTPIPIMVGADQAWFPARLLNLSQNGMAIEAEARLPVGKPVLLEGAGFDSARGSVRWRRGKVHGIVLQESTRIDALARLVARLQTMAVGHLEPGRARFG